MGNNNTGGEITNGCTQEQTRLLASREMSLRAQEVKEKVDPGEEEAELRSRIFQNVFFPGGTRFPQIHYIREAVITNMQFIRQAEHEWTKFWFEFFTAPFLFYGKLPCVFYVGDTVDIEYCFSVTRENIKFLCLYDIYHSSCKSKQM